MIENKNFWLISIVIWGVALFVGFWLAPNWTLLFQTDQQRLSHLYQSVWCPICEGETIATSQTQISHELRDLIRELVEQGMSDPEIYAYIEQKYGTEQVAVPRHDWLSRLAYALPYLIIASLIWCAYWLGWEWSSKSSGHDDGPGPDKEREEEILELSRKLESPLD